MSSEWSEESMGGPNATVRFLVERVNEAFQWVNSGDQCRFKPAKRGALI